MRFDWKLQPLQRKLEWDLDLARGRVATLSRQQAQAQAALRLLENSRAAQAAVAQAATQRRADPALHVQALAWLATAELQLVCLRAQSLEAEAALADARAACLRCNERVEALAVLHGEALARFAYAVQREAAKEADFAWLGRRARQELA